MNRDEVPPSHIYFSLLMEEWIMMTFVMKNCLLDLFVVLDLDLEPIWIDNSWGFFVSQKLELNIIYFIVLTTVWTKSFRYVCRFLWKISDPKTCLYVKCPKIQSTYFVNRGIYMYIGSIV